MILKGVGETHWQDPEYAECPNCHGVLAHDLLCPTPELKLRSITDG
jgi:hypothetical protein